MPLRALTLLLVSSLAWAQPTRNPYEDEPTPHGDPPPTIYVPIPPPIIAPPPYAPQPPPEAKPPKKKTGFVFGADLGGAYRYALKSNFGAGALRLLIGGESGRVGFGGVTDLEMGGSKNGLFYTVIDFGFVFYGRLGENVRLGIGPQFGMMVIQRATDSNPLADLRGFVAGLSATLHIDLLKSRSAALGLFGRLRYDYLDTGPVSPYSHGASAQVGVSVRL